MVFKVALRVIAVTAHQSASHRSPRTLIRTG